MAIAKTGAIYKSLSFDGVTSRTYGVYITGQAVYNAPQRDVEMISIPGRNGAFPLDHGRFENIEVTYPAGIFAENETDFAQAISDFRNYLCSRKGYVRLSDEYNPDEYRLAVYKSGLEVDPALLRAGEFDITFDCKPQRWLTSGETQLTVLDGETITNPTLFDASPIVKVNGHGTFSVDDQSITVNKVTVGDVFIANSKRKTITYPINYSLSLAEVVKQTINLDKLNTGDRFTLSSSSFTYNYKMNYADDAFLQVSATSQTGTGVSTTATIQNQDTAIFYTEFSPISFVKGTAKTVAHSYTGYLKWGEYSYYTNPSVDIQIEYDGGNTITLSADGEESGTWTAKGIGQLGEVNGFSTVPITGEITIDLDIGEAYWRKNGKLISANFAVELGSELLKLKSGENLIAYSSTFTSCKIVPRWWKI